MKINDKNILINQYSYDNSVFSIKEVTPLYSNYDNDIKFLSDKIKWNSIKGSDKIIISNNSDGDIIIDCSIDMFSDTGIYFNEGNIGFGSIPLHNYKVDIRVPVNTKSTALHIGDGIYGFSLGNATEEGFLPQIIGIGSDKDDAGLYFLGKVPVDLPSNTPAIIFDGRDLFNDALQNRPILGVTSGSYNDYKFLIDANGRVGIGKFPEIYKMEVNGSILAKNIIVETSTYVFDLIKEIDSLKQKIKSLEQKLL